jgi:hypothetical protein
VNRQPLVVVGSRGLRSPGNSAGSGSSACGEMSGQRVSGEGFLFLLLVHDAMTRLADVAPVVRPRGQPADVCSPSSESDTSTTR